MNSGALRRFSGNPVKKYDIIKDYIALYPGKMDACYVDDEQVQAQEGVFMAAGSHQALLVPSKAVQEHEDGSLTQ